ncbi:TPR-like protein [Rhizophagus irregularis]|uniref:TPR-like protein n=1 Tax=Rhizophagus irregularis TaxID=588596 RepID=A0A2N0P622_9GLOM|nr:TPR-like protein [Rhizophagus irregularis]
MEGNSNQNGSSSFVNSSIKFRLPLLENISNNCILLELEQDGFITPDEKAEELIKNLTKLNYLFALKLLFETPFNQFSDEALRNSLVALADPTPFDYYGKQSMVRLELHIRTWIAVLEKICVTPMRLSKELRDKVYSSLAKFAEIHKKTTQVMQEGIDNNFRSEFNQFNQLHDNKENEDIMNKRNYNIDFLLIHLRDTLHSLRDDETWFQEIIRRTKELLKAALNITPGALSALAPGVALPNDNCSILSMLTQLRKGLNFKYPVASYYVDWRIMLIIQHNLFNWSGGTENIISKKFQEMVLMEYFWSYLEKEWIDVTDNSILDSQSKFDEISNKLVKVFKNTGNFINDLVGNEPLALPHTLWFGILDLAQNLIQRSTRKSTHGLCYYLAIESLNRAPSSFIQFKAIEILFHLHNINKQMFSIIEIDFNQYIQKLNETDSTTDSSEKFQNLLTFVKKKCADDFNLLNYNIEKGRGKGKEKEKCASIQNTNLTKKISKLGEILEMIANEMTCPIDHEPTDQLCVLKCQHILSFNNLKKLKQKNCPKCRENIEDNDIRYLPQNVIYKHLYSQFFEAGHILPSIEIEDSINNQYDSDSDNSEVDLMLTKKKKILKAIRLNSNISLKSIFQIGKKQHPTYLNAIKELKEKNYKNAEHWCKEFLKTYPESYSIRCILAYTYRCFNNYEQAHLYLNEAIELKGKKPNAWYIRGEIHLRQGNYNDAVKDLTTSIYYNANINNLYTILGISYYNNNDEYALKNFNIMLKKDPNNYLCLRYCAYIYEKQGKFSDTSKILDKLLSISEKDSLILCYYGEILSKMKKYDSAIPYFTKANNIDPENVHNLTKRAIIYYILQEYDNALLDFSNIIQLDTSNILAYYCKGLIYFILEDNSNSIVAFKNCIELDPKNDLEKMYLKESSNYLTQISNIDYNSKCLPNYHNLIANISEFANINYDKSLLLMRCKIYIELKKYEDAVLDLDRLFELNDDISFAYLLQKYSDFWLYLCKSYLLNDRVQLGITYYFNLYMYRVKGIYFMSNLMKFNCNYQFRESYLNGRTLSPKGNYLSLPEFSIADMLSVKKVFYDIIWKINIKKIISSNCFIRFIVEKKCSFINKSKKEYVLQYKDILKLEGLGWISYVTFCPIYLYAYDQIQLSIETKKDSIDMQIEYVRLTPSHHKERIYFPKMDYLLPFYAKNIPETFKDKYFLRKETENLLELNDIIDNL